MGTLVETESGGKPLGRTPPRKVFLGGRLQSLRAVLAASFLFMSPLLFRPLAAANHGAAWQSYGLRGQTVWNLTIASAAGEHILYAETSTGLWRRRADVGNSAWQRIDEGLPRAGGLRLGGPALVAWRPVPGRPLQLYALTGEGTVRQLHRTTDGGDTWSSIGPAPGQTAHPALAIIPGSSVLADTVVVATETRLQRSLDGGATWSPGGAWPETGRGREPVRTVLAEATAPGWLFALSDTGDVWVTDNGGLSWRASQPVENSQGSPLGATAVAIAPSFGAQFWAAADKLFVTGDNGGTWQAASLPTARANERRVTALRADPRVQGCVYAALRGGGVYGTQDAGTSWSFLGIPGGKNIVALAVDPESRSLLYAATDDGIWVRSVVPLQPTPVPPTATAVSTSTPTATQLPTATPSPTATTTLTVTPSPEPTETATASPSPTLTSTATATSTRRPTRPPARATDTPAPVTPPTPSQPEATTAPPVATQAPFPTVVVQPSDTPGIPPPR